MITKKMVIIPTYNEKENIEAIVRKVFSLGDFHILVVEDSLTEQLKSSKNYNQNFLRVYIFLSEKAS